MYTKIQSLTDEENNKISSCIKSIIEKEDKTCEAIYINSYHINNKVHIDIQLVKNNIYQIKKEIVSSNIDNIIISKIEVPTIIFMQSMEYYRETCHPMNLLNSEIIKDTKDKKYQELASLAGGFGFNTYNNNVTFSPPLKIKKK